MTDDLMIDDAHLIPDAALTWTFGPTGGPGGQHANRSHTRAELRFDLGSSPVFADSMRTRMLDNLDTKDGVVTVIADDTRSQWRNRQTARRRLKVLLIDAMKPPPVRRQTRKPRSADRKRLAEKRRRSEQKASRRRPDPE